MFYHLIHMSIQVKSKAKLPVWPHPPASFQVQSMRILGPMCLELPQKMCPSSGVPVVDAGFWQDGLVFWLDGIWQWWSLRGKAGRLDAAGLIVSQKHRMERAERRTLTHISSQAGWTVVQSTLLYMVVLFYRPCVCFILANISVFTSLSKKAIHGQHYRHLLSQFNWESFLSWKSAV